MPVLLLTGLSAEGVEASHLVLEATGIAHTQRHGEHGYEIWVDRADFGRAAQHLNLYCDENADAARPQTRSVKVLRNSTGVWVAGLLMAVQLHVDHHFVDRGLIKAFGSDAARVLGGEWYRVVTALFLHGDAAHLGSNMAAIALFGSAVCSITGIGVGWLLILLAGALGNLLNAGVYGSGHLSIGASTAVFGAIGLLAGQQWIVKHGVPGQKLRAWLPLGAGLALLGLLGSSPVTDRGAHLFGFLAGVLFGALHAGVVREAPRWPVQVACGLLGVGVVLSAWVGG